MTDLPLMNIRTFLRGGYRDLLVPTTIISGTTRLGVWLPDGAPRPAHPVPDARGDLADVHAGGATPQGARLPAGERTEAPQLGGSVLATGGGATRPAPARRSIQQTLDRAAKEARS